MSSDAEKNASTAQFDRVERGRVYPAEVIAQLPTGTYAVRVNGTDTVLKGCLYATGIISGMLGVNTGYIIPEGAEVAVVPGTPNLIVGMYHSVPSDPITAKKHACTTERGTRTDLKSFNPEVNPGEPVYGGGDIPSDLLPGELDLTNLFGVGIQLLLNFSKLCAGEGAKVEVHLLNDMVRIFSGVFRHHSAFGDTEIYDDGRLNVEQHGTSYPHEAWGLLNPTDEKLPASMSGVDKVDEVDTANPRWRFSNYMGFLGSFINAFVTDPVAMLAEGAHDHRSGKARAHVGTDGSFLLQSVAEIAFERVVRIPVPRRLLRSEDPEGVKVADFEALDQSLLKLWRQPKNPLDMYQTTFQLREYARYLSQYQSLMRFHQMAQKKGEWEVPSESATPAPAWTAGEKDVESANAGQARVEYYDTYATIRMMRDGSIIHWDGCGSCVVMSHGDIYHCAVRNLTFEAGGDIRFLAGQNIYARARRNFEIVAMVGGIRMKARAFFHQLCERGTLWLKSDARDPSEPGFTAPKPDDETTDPAIIYNDAAVLIESSRGRTTVDSSRTLTLATSAAPDNDQPTDNSASIVLQSKQFLKLRGAAGVSMISETGFIVLNAIRRTVLIRARRFLAKVSRGFRINNGFDVNSAGIARVRAVQAGRISSLGSIINLSGRVGKIDEEYKAIYDPTPEQDLEMDEDVIAADSIKARPDHLYPVSGELTFRFDSFTDYVTDSTIFMESPAQQYIRMDTPEAWSEQWTIQPAGKLDSAPRVDSNTAPFPGAGAQYMTHTGGENLRVASGKTGADLNVTTEMKRQPYQFAFLKRDAKFRP